MAAVITEYVEDMTQFSVTCQLDTNGEASVAVPLHNGFLQGGAYSARSGAAAYTVSVQYSVNGINWLTLVSLTDVAPVANFTAASLSSARFLRFSATTVNSQTITIWSRGAR